MNSNEPNLPNLADKMPEDTIRENLTRAMVKYRGNVQAYYAELLKKVPVVLDEEPWKDLERVAAIQLRAYR